MFATHCAAAPEPAHVSTPAAAAPNEPAAAFVAKQHRILNDTDVWETETGESVTLSSFRDKNVVLTMLYTHCRKICPMVTVDTLHEVERVLHDRQEPVELLIATLDPEVDTPRVLADFKVSSGFARPNVHFLRGSNKATRRLASSMGLGDFWRDDDHIEHGFRIVLLDLGRRQERRLDWDHRDVPKALAF
jgi:cytochrome oxidase Cu insertion factor (SCO1/SenC/PrrC family)